jgi:hypothetical protein
MFYLLINVEGSLYMFRSLFSLTIACSMLFSSTGLLSNGSEEQLPMNTTTTEQFTLTCTSTKSSETTPVTVEPVQVTEAPVVQEPKRETYAEYVSRQYNAKRGVTAAALGTTCLALHGLYDHVVKTAGNRYLPAFFKYMSPTLLAWGTAACVVAAAAPLEKHVDENQAYYGFSSSKEEVRDRNLITKLWALGGLVVAGGIIATDYVLPYLATAK